jgi:hypothetical protein
MKKLIIGLASLLFLAQLASANPLQGKVEVHYVNQQPTFTEVGILYYESPHYEILAASAVILKNSHLELEKQGTVITSGDRDSGTYSHEFKMLLKASPAEIREFLGEPLVIGIRMHVQNDKIGPLPVEYKGDDLTISFSKPSLPPATSPVAPIPPVVPVPTPPTNGMPKAPGDAPSRDINLFTEAQVAEAVAKALKDTVTLAEREAAEHKAADLAFKEGVAAVQARPDFYGLATTSLLGTQPFVKGWVYTPELEWVNITEDLFPFVFVEKLGSWVLIQEKEEGLAYFVYLTGKWLTYEELKVSQ